ncbi:Hypothetical predicted protein, partial [Pelobates cultripes]
PLTRIFSVVMFILSCIRVLIDVEEPWWGLLSHRGPVLLLLLLLLLSYVSSVSLKSTEYTSTITTSVAGYTSTAVLTSPNGPSATNLSVGFLLHVHGENFRGLVDNSLIPMPNLLILSKNYLVLVNSAPTRYTGPNPPLRGGPHKPLRGGPKPPLRGTPPTAQGGGGGGPPPPLRGGGRRANLKHSEAILTSVFSTMLVIVILTILILAIKKYRRRRLQYSHHPLREQIYESVDSYSTPDDTLVISGGLYEAPRIYNPNMTVLEEEEESQHEYVSFSSRPGQFRLEFLPTGNAS